MEPKLSRQVFGRLVRDSVDTRETKKSDQRLFGAASSQNNLARYRERARRGKTRVLAVGDSWFAVTCGAAGIPEVLEYEHGYAVLNLREVGAELGQISDPDQFSRLETALDMMAEYDPGKPNDTDTLPPAEIVLLSGGGNEIIGDEFPNYLVPEEDANGDGGFEQRIRQQTFFDMLDVLNTAITDFAATVRSRVGDEARVLVHGYDFVTPRDVPHLCFGIAVSGPWIHPYLVDPEVNITDEEIQKSIVEWMIRKFAEKVLTPLNDDGVIEHVNLLGELERNLDYFYDEIHPNLDGMKKLARVFDERMQAS